MKKFGLVALLGLVALGVVACGNTNTSEQPAGPTLPGAWEEGETYQAIECSVSLVPGSITNDAGAKNDDAKPVKDYLNVEGIRFFDLRDVSEGYGIGHIQGFESVSYFKTIVGKDNQLFYTDADGKYVARYAESETILNDIFSKEDTLFVMCQVGGRVTPFLKLLAQYNYDMSKVYNVGGWNQIKDLKDFGGYEVSLGIGASAIEYDFSSLTPAAPKAAKRAAASNELPAAWEEGETYQSIESSVSLVPGSITNDAGAKNDDAVAVKNFLTTENIRFFDLRDAQEGYGLGHIQKFETVSYFKTIVGKDNQLFYTDADGKYVARYAESETILNDIFPKDATLFVMCQVGGRVTPFLKLLAQYNYDMSKVYNVGGWNQIKDLKDFGGYDVSLGITAKSITYDFSSLTVAA